MISFSKEERFIVTGATSGLGEGIALLLNELGASVIAIGRNSQKLESLKDRAKSPDCLHTEEKDLGLHIELLPSYITELKNIYGKFKGLVCSAGITETCPVRFLDLEEMKKLYDINYFSPVMCVKGFADRRNNMGKGSSVVCISSEASHMSSRGMTTYSGAKAALVSSMNCIARELAPQGVRVNCVSPSHIVTPMTLDIPDIMETTRNDYPMGLGEVSDVANVVVFLLSEKAKWISRSSYQVHGCSF